MREKIILFIQNSPDEVNSNVAAFIAGMQAQKKLMASQWKTDNCPFLTIEEDSPDKGLQSKTKAGKLWRT